MLLLLAYTANMSFKCQSMINIATVNTNQRTWTTCSDMSFTLLLFKSFITIFTYKSNHLNCYDTIVDIYIKQYQDAIIIFYIHYLIIKLRGVQMFLVNLQLADEVEKKQFCLPEKVRSIRISRETLNELNITKILTQQEYKQLAYILYCILAYPSVYQSEIHHNANRLGKFDLKNEQSLLISQNSKNGKVKNEGIEVIQNKQYCKCCGYVKQEHIIPICAPFQDFPSLGLSAYSFFQNIRNMIYLLILVFLLVGIYGFITNLHTSGIHSQQFQQNFEIADYHKIIQSISLGSKKLSQEDLARLLYLVQMWMGVGLVILWSLALCLIRYSHQKSQKMIDLTTISASDFSIIIQNYPKNITKSDLQAQLQKYYQQLSSLQKQSLCDSLQVQKINMHEPRSSDSKDQQQLTKINQQYQQALQTIIDWVIQFKNKGFKLQKQKRFKQYQLIQIIKQKRNSQAIKILSDLAFCVDNGHKRRSIFAPGDNPQIDQKRFTIVTFKYSKAKDLMVKYNSMNFSQTIRYYLTCCHSQRKFYIKQYINTNEQKFHKLKIYRAPQPEDILWQNLQTTLCQKIIRKAGTYFVTLLLLGISFGSVYGLTVQQLKNSQNFYLSILISVSIAIINGIISFLIAQLTNFQGNYTETGHQTSLAIKSIFAQLINSIVFPVIANYLIEQQNIYGNNGLATDIIYLGITNSLLSPFLRIIDPKYRFWAIRAYFYKKSIKNRLSLQQTEFNIKQQLPNFQIGYEYIYFINLYLFTAFFISLQPAIGFIAILGMISGYWMLKYCLLYRLKRPIPGTDIISNAMGQFIAVGPIFYELGNLVWSHFLQDYRQSERQIIFYIPNLVGIGIAIIFFIFPFTIICQKWFQDVDQEDLQYQNCRILLNSQYDRMNPATMQRAIKEYQQYVLKYIEDIDKDKTNTKKGHKKLTQYAQKFRKTKKIDLNKKFDTKQKIHPKVEDVQKMSKEIEEVDEKNYSSFQTHYDTQQNILDASHHPALFNYQSEVPDNNDVINRQFLKRKKNLIRSRPHKGKNMINNILRECSLEKQVLGELIKVQGLSSPKVDFQSNQKAKKRDQTNLEQISEDMRQSKLQEYFKKVDQNRKKHKKIDNLSYSFPHQNAIKEQQAQYHDLRVNVKPKFDHSQYFGTNCVNIKPAHYRNKKNHRYNIKNPYDQAF